MFGNFLTACTIAYPIRWVNEILPPRVRLRWLLMTIRLSIISFAGMVRTLVAVGIVRLWSMFTDRVFAMPRRGVVTSSGVSPACILTAGASAGIGWARGAIDVVRA